MIGSFRNHPILGWDINRIAGSRDVAVHVETSATFALSCSHGFRFSSEKTSLSSPAQPPQIRGICSRNTNVDPYSDSKANEDGAGPSCEKYDVTDRLTCGRRSGGDNISARGGGGGSGGGCQE